MSKKGPEGTTKKTRQRRRMLRIPPGYKNHRGVKIAFGVINEFSGDELAQIIQALSKVITPKTSSNSTPGYVCFSARGVKLTDEFLKQLGKLIPTKRKRSKIDKK